MKIVELKQTAPGVPNSLEVGEAVKSGGEGKVFFSRDSRYAVKIYHRTSEAKEKKLRDISAIFSAIPAGQARFILPPLALVARMDGQPCTGFVMRRVPTPPFQELVALVKNPMRSVPQFEQKRTWEDYLKLARSVANCVAVLHGKGCAHGDIHYRNFLADIATGAAVMLELDGIIIEGFMRSDVKGFMGFMAPEVLVKDVSPSLRTDCYSLAVLTLHTLLLRNVMEPQIEYDPDSAVSMREGFGKYAVFSEHPQDTRNRPENLDRPLYEGGALSYKMLPPRLQRLTEQALMVQLHVPEERPSSKNWADALAATLDEVTACQQCDNRFPYPYWKPAGAGVACPFCGAAPAKSPLVIKLFEEGRRNEFRALDRALALAKDARLYEDMTQARAPTPLAEQERVPIGRVDWNAPQGCYRLVNESNQPWTARPLHGGNRRMVQTGEALSVEAGMCIQFGSGQRVGVVQHRP